MIQGEATRPPIPRCASPQTQPSRKARSLREGLGPFVRPLTFHTLCLSKRRQGAAPFAGAGSVVTYDGRECMDVSSVRT